MMWEDYLTLAVRDVADKYQARRLKASMRSELLALHAIYRAEGLNEDEALVRAMDTLGDPEHLSQRMARPMRYQHGWLWLLSVAQLIVGVGIVAVSLKTESFAALALGRIMALWGMVATGLQTRRTRDIGNHLKLLRVRLHHVRRTVKMRDFGRMVWVGFGTGLLLALVASLPWNLVTANMFHPVFLSTSSAFVLSGLTVGVPWGLLRRWVGPGFYVVTLEAWAALSAAIAATALILWHQGFAPPPLFNWPPEMLLAGGWLFNFALLRAVAVLAALKDRVLVGFDEDRSPLF